MSGQSFTPLHDAVEAYLAKDMARFHIPGHKGQGEGAFADILPWDITEVAGVDSLYQAQGPILAMENAFARTYGAKRSLLCAGGSTLCIQTMLALACGDGGRVIMSRNIHRAALNAAALLDLEPTWIYPENDAGGWFLGRYTPETVRAALEEQPDAQAVYITSPDYFGVISDLAGIAAVCKECSVPLLVDNAHGAHLKFMPKAYGVAHPLDCGATLSCDSLHKTMPAMTGAAILHINDETYIPHAKRMMALFGSTSPSYPILLSCETALRYACDGAREGFARVAQECTALAQMARAKGLATPIGATDPVKLSLAFGAAGLSAETFGATLRAGGVEPEYLSGTACVLMANAMNRAEDFTRITRTLAALAPSGASAAPVLHLPRPEQGMRLREAVFSTQVEIFVENAAGRIAAGEISPCPPGIPVVMGGERIDTQTLAALTAYGIDRVSVVTE